MEDPTDPGLRALRARSPEFVIAVARLPLGEGAPVVGFVAAIVSPEGALPARNSAARRVASGLDATLEGAIARTIGEATERHCACFHDAADERRAAARELGDAAVDVEAMLMASARQRAMAELWNRRHAGRQAIVSPPDPDSTLGWMTSDPRYSSALRHVPAALVKLGHPDRTLAPALVATSAGVACADDAERAMLAATLELVEHDAVAIWWYNAIARPACRIDGSALIDDVGDWLRRHDRALHLLDLTHDLGVPVVAAVTIDHSGRRPVIGTAAALDRRDAAEAAVREMLLGLVNLQRLEATGAARGLGAFDADTAAQLAWHRAETLATAPWLAPDASAMAAPARRPCATLADLKTRLERRGLELLAFDLSRAGVDGRVFRVVVPGLRSTLARFAPGRLYDVPVALGWRGVATAEAALIAEPYPG